MWDYLLDCDEREWLIAASTAGVDHMTETDGPQNNSRCVQVCVQVCVHVCVHICVRLSSGSVQEVREIIYPCYLSRLPFIFF